MQVTDKELITIENNIQLFPISSKVSKEGHLHIGGCSVIELAKKYGTPLYILDKESIIQRAKLYINSFKKYYPNSLVLYAAKALATPALYKIYNKLGIGLDVVSGGELYIALKSGFKKENIYLHGNNKSKKELELAINNKIGRIVCDNIYELELLHKITSKHSTPVNISIRLNPGIECHTHEYIKTGHIDSKFGLDLEYLDDVLKIIKNKSKNLNLVGLHSHIGSQIFEINPYLDTVSILLEKIKYIKSNFNIDIKEVNIGGGIGISYTKSDDPFSIEEWIITLTKYIEEKSKELEINLPNLICEPGRSLISPCGVTIYTAGSTKQVPNGKKYISVDGGMADNPRPITYNAEYMAVVANKMNIKNIEKVTISGRYCESGDILIKDILLPKIEPGDIIAILNTGAYNYSMSSNYNMVPRPAYVLVCDGTSDVIIERETYDDLIHKHRIPENILDF